MSEKIKKIEEQFLKDFDVQKAKDAFDEALVGLNLNHIHYMYLVDAVYTKPKKKELIEDVLVHVFTHNVKSRKVLLKAIDKCKTEKERKVYAEVLSNYVTSGEDVRRYEGMALVKIMKESWSEDVFEECKGYMLEEYRELEKGLITLESIPDYGEGSDKNTVYRYCLEHHFEIMVGSVFEEELFKVLHEVVEEDLKTNANLTLISTSEKLILKGLEFERNEKKGSKYNFRLKAENESGIEKIYSFNALNFY